MPDLPSLEALAGAAGFELERGFQVLGPRGAATVDASEPLLVLGAPPARVLRRYPPETGVTPLVARDGAVRTGPVMAVGALPGEGETAVAWAFPALPAEAVRDDLRGLVGVIARLRDPESGCPWDLAQDHRSLRRHLLEETYEVLEALDALDEPAGPARLREELGDLLMQIVLQARVAEQAGTFTLGEVAEGIRAKLVRRHPHVFGEVEAETPEEVEANWEEIKAEERASGSSQGESAVDGVPASLPALARAQTLSGRASRRGFAWASDGDVLAKLAEELEEITAAAEGGAGGRGGGLAVRGVRLPAAAGGGGGGCAAGSMREVREAVPGAGGRAGGGGGGDGRSGPGGAAGAVGKGEGGRNLIPQPPLQRGGWRGGGGRGGARMIARAMWMKRPCSGRVEPRRAYAVRWSTEGRGEAGSGPLLTSQAPSRWRQSWASLGR